MNNGMRLLFGSTCIAVLVSAQAPAQQPANPLVAGQEAVYSTIKNNLIRAAEKMPEENYSFRPTPEVMSFAEMVGHVADSQYTYCYSVTGQRLPAAGPPESQEDESGARGGVEAGILAVRPGDRRSHRRQSPGTGAVVWASAAIRGQFPAQPKPSPPTSRIRTRPSAPSQVPALCICSSVSSTTGRSGGKCGRVS